MSIEKSVDEDLKKNHNSRLTYEGCNVLLYINDGDRVVFSRLTAASTLKIGNKKCSLQPLIDCPFGSLFQVESGKEGTFLTRFVENAEAFGRKNHLKRDKKTRMQRASRCTKHPECHAGFEDGPHP